MTERDLCLRPLRRLQIPLSCSGKLHEISVPGTAGRSWERTNTASTSGGGLLQPASYSVEVTRQDEII